MLAVKSRGELEKACSRQDHLDLIKRKRIRKRAIKQIHRDYANRDSNFGAERERSAPIPAAA